MSGRDRTSRQTRRLAFLLLVLVLAAVPPLFSAGAAEPVTTDRMSVATSGSQATGGASEWARVSADGSRVVFHSWADDLVAGDSNGDADIFVRDRETGETVRVSVRTGGGEATGASLNPAISGDGQHVAFYSWANDLVSGDTNGTPDVFVHDLASGQTERVSVKTGGGQASGGASWFPTISADGRYVAFYSGADDLVPGDSNGVEDSFVHDRQTGETTRVSVKTDGGQATGGDSVVPFVSASGRFVTYSSDATDLVPGDNNGLTDIFFHDRLTGETTRVSVRSDGAEATNGHSYHCAASGDGRYVVISSGATNLVPGDTNGKMDVFVHDRETASTTRVSVTPSGGQATGGDSREALISADGRFVTFRSAATNLVSGDSAGETDVFVRDLVAGETERFSLRTGGTQANNSCYRPSVTTGGRYASYGSIATNLVAGDTNGVQDAFVSGIPATTDELAGPTRYETAIAASQEAYPNGLMTDTEGNRTVVIATGENWPDALGGSALAGVHGGPILLTLTAALPDPVTAEIQRLDATDAIILGGPGAVSPAVETALAAELGATNVRRLGGATRYETAELIARAVANATESHFDGTALVSTGLNFPDALAGSPLAAAGHRPIFLVPQTGMTPSTLATMSDIGVTDVVILGGTGVVSQGIETALAGAVSGDVTRLAGPTRYETAVEVAMYGKDDAALSFAYTAIATGENFPDALAGGVLQGRDRGVMLLTHSASLTPSTASALKEEAMTIAQVRYLGGTGALSQAARDEVDELLVQ